MNTPISQLGEFGLINHLTKNINIVNKSTIKGIGDDCAVIDNRDALTVVSTDLLAEGIHFDLMYSPLKHLGYKAVVVNLSDIYAMNATPHQITVSMALSSRFPVEALEELYEGMLTACRIYNVDLVGGDTSSSRSGLFLSLTAIGDAQPDELVFRNGAKVGDIICVSGNLGAAYLGLQLLEREKQLFLEDPNIKPDLEDQNYLVGRQLKPEARRDIIQLLKRHRIQPTAMIDVSDGLSSDMLHICHQSKVGCRIFEDNIPLHPHTYQMAFKFNIIPSVCALSGGEDYELLFTVSPDRLAELEELEEITIIGKIVPEQEGCKLITPSNNEHTLVAQGWNHLDE